MLRGERIVRTGLARYHGIRDKIELAVPACMLMVCIDSLRRQPGVDEDEKQLMLRVKPDIAIAALEPFMDYPRQRQEAILDVCMAVAMWTLEGFDKISLPLVTQGMIYWLRRQIDAGYLVLGDQSAFRRAADAVIAHLLAEEDGKLVDRFDYGAEGIADGIEERLASIGLMMRVETAA